MYKEINVRTFLEKSGNIPVVDARTPDEFQHGHITGAINIPLFETIERAAIGRIYKLHGREEAIMKGLEFTSGKIGKLITAGKESTVHNKLLIHCWRGGMRSASIAWLFETTGIECYVLEGGYKAYRKYVLDFFQHPRWRLIVIGGMTGSGKTDILIRLREKGYQVLDLEELAHHKGSAFGALGEKEQNSNEQFENDLFSSLAGCDPGKPVWIEDESRNIGKNLIPSGFFSQIMNAPLICLETDNQSRINRLVRDYATYPADLLEKCILKISRRLGGLTTRSAIESLKQGNFNNVAELMLDYYDKTYTYSLTKREFPRIHRVKIHSDDINTATDKVLKLAASNSWFI